MDFRGVERTRYLCASSSYTARIPETGLVVVVRHVWAVWELITECDTVVAAVVMDGGHDVLFLPPPSVLTTAVLLCAPVKPLGAIGHTRLRISLLSLSLLTATTIIINATPPDGTELTDTINFEYYYRRGIVYV